VIEFATYLFPGKFEKYINIDTDISGQPRQVITLAGVVDPMPMSKISIEPRKTKLGTIQMNTQQIVPLTISNTGTASLNITKIYSKKSSVLYYDAEEKGEIQIAAGKSRRIEIVIKPQKAGRFIEVIQVKCNARNAGTKGLYQILATATVE
jgi:hypothetical protein